MIDTDLKLPTFADVMKVPDLTDSTRFLLDPRLRSGYTEEPSMPLTVFKVEREGDFLYFSKYVTSNEELSIAHMTVARITVFSTVGDPVLTFKYVIDPCSEAPDFIVHSNLMADNSEALTLRVKYHIRSLEVTAR